MNIFLFSADPEQCAQMAPDIYTFRMIYENAFMMSRAHQWSGNIVGYRGKNHRNHPCTVWVRESLGNYKWMLKYSVELNKGWVRRYGHSPRLFLNLRYPENEIKKYKQRVIPQR